jgi:hypothetical protein
MANGSVSDRDPKTGLGQIIAALGVALDGFQLQANRGIDDIETAEFIANDLNGREGRLFQRNRIRRPNSSVSRVWIRWRIVRQMR